MIRGWGSVNPAAMKALPLIALFLLPLTAPLLAEEESASPAAEASPSAEPTPAPQVDETAIAATDLSTLEGKVGQDVVVEGVVEGVSASQAGNITFLNFGDRRTGFVCVAFRPSYDKFPGGLEAFEQKKVRVRGKLEKYKDRQLQIRIFGHDQIEILPGGPS